MDVFRVIKEDHDKVRMLIKEISETTERASETRKKKFEQLYHEVVAHHTTEEQVVVPVLKEVKEMREMGIEIVEEHHVLRAIMDELKALDPAEENWPVKFNVMNEIMEHHLKDEEVEISKEAHAKFRPDQLDKLGEEFEKVEKQERQKLM